MVQSPATDTTALVVDDHEDTRELVQLWLESRGVKVRAAASARDALAIISAEPVHLLVSDLEMPEQDGYSLIKAIRALPDESKARIPALALSGLSSAHARMTAIEAGFDVHLPKPCDSNELLATVAILVHRGSNKSV
jgi:CheY-like chemotaxis protein